MPSLGRLPSRIHLLSPRGAPVQDRFRFSQQGLSMKLLGMPKTAIESYTESQELLLLDVHPFINVNGYLLADKTSACGVHSNGPTSLLARSEHGRVRNVWLSLESQMSGAVHWFRLSRQNIAQPDPQPQLDYFSAFGRFGFPLSLQERWRKKNTVYRE